MKRLIGICAIVVLSASCANEFEPKKENKIFHAGPNVSGFGCAFFSLYKGDFYEFCDGDFIDPGCYTGKYVQDGDKLELEGIKFSDYVSSNRFIIFRYSEQDSTYWKRKYPDSVRGWESDRNGDLAKGAEGDIFELDENDQPKMNQKYYYVIRHDDLKNR